MKVSIIVPIYNAEEHLPRCLDSILDQSHKNIELILINDGSKDKSLEICRKHESKDKRLVVLDIENSGPGVARNKGIEIATGDYIAFVDADDYIDHYAIETLVKIAVEGEYEVVSASHYRVDREVTVSKNNYKTGEISRSGDPKGIERYNLFKTSSSFGYIWGKVYKTSFIEENKVKFSDQRAVFLEDTLFNLKLISYNPKYYVLNQPLYYYNIYEDSLSNKKEDITDKAIKMLEDYGEFLREENLYDENLDLLVPLASRTIAWSLFKTMENSSKLNILHKRAEEFSDNDTVRMIFNKKSSLSQVKKLDSTLQFLLYSFVILSIGYSLKKLLALAFYLNYPLFKVYINKSLKA